MKNLLIFTLVLTFSGIVGIRYAEAQEKNPKLDAEIEKVLRDFSDAWRRGDADGVTKFYVDEGFFYDPEGFKTLAQGKGEISVYLSAKENYPNDTYEIKDLSVVSINEDTAVANFSVIGTLEREGKKTVTHDRTTNVFVRREGRWLIAVDHTSRLPNRIEPTVSGMPVSWIRTGSNSSSEYLITVDKTIKHGGKASVSIQNMCAADGEFNSLAQTVAADNFRGKRVRLSGWLKTEQAEMVGLWMRVDGNNRILGFDNMANRAVKGTTNWKKFEVVLDIPSEAVNIFFGTLIGKGKVWADDFKLEIVGQNIPSTNMLSPEQMNMEINRNTQKSTNNQAVNLGFEDGIMP